MQKPAVAIVGAGKVGSALAVRLYRQGYPLAGIASRNGNAAEGLAHQCSTISSVSAAEVARKANIVFLTVPDRFIGEVATKIGAEGGVVPGQWIFHTAGSLTAEVLNPIKYWGAFVGSMHPLQTFANVEAAEKNIPGSYFALDGDPEAVTIAQEIVRDLGGQSFLVPNKERPIYHAAACIASNYMVTLVHSATKLYGRFGLSPEEALQALYPLLYGTLTNLQKMGTTAALTGPISRGDSSTVSRHLAALSECGGEELDLYKIVGLHTVEIALTKGTINQQQAKELSEILK